MKKNNNKLVLYLIPIGIAVNFVVGSIITLLKLPLYLDCIGTIIVGALCGVWPGVIVGLITNILNAIADPTILFYAPLNMAFGVLAAFLSKKGWFKNFGLTLLSSIFFAFIGGGIGSLITWVLYGFDFGSGRTAIVSVPLYETLHVSKYIAQFIGETAIDLIDKVATVIICFFILKAFPTRFLTKLPLGPIYISDELKKQEEEISKKAE
jgi:energy-coupling factor transport system substrate-specific component